MSTYSGPPPWYAAASSAIDAPSQLSAVSSSSSGPSMGEIISPPYMPPPPPQPAPPSATSAPIINPPVAREGALPEGVPAAAYDSVGVGAFEPSLPPGPRPEGLSATGPVLPGRTQRKVLILVSGEDHLDLLSGKRKETGFFLNELAVPYLKLKAQGYQTIFANPNGRQPHMDSNSDSRVFFGFSREELQRAKTALVQDPSFQNPVPFYALTEKDLADFRGVFIPGGHAPMQDLYNNFDVGRIMSHFHLNMKPTAAICHGPAALLPARAPDGSWLYFGYGMCCYSNKEEWPIECLWWDTIPHKLETLLRESGANLLNGMPLADRVVEDRELVTGQNPRSVERLAARFTEKLNAAL